MSEPGKKVLVWGLTSNVGGLEMVVKNYVGRISPSDVRFDFVTTHESMVFEDWVLELGSEVLYLPSRSKDPIGYKQAIDRFSSECLGSYDAVWLNDCRWGNLDILVKAKKVGVPRRIAHAHNTRDIADGQVRILRHKANRIRIASLATDFWACSLAAAKWCFNESQLESQRFRVVRNAVDVGRFSFDEETRTRMRRQLRLGDLPTYINVGRLDHQKNQAFLLEAFKELLALQPESVLLLVGGGPDEGALRAKARDLGLGDSVLFLGFRSDIPELLCSADCFMMPSLFEGLSLVLVEARASGLPCLCSDAITPEVAILGSLERIPLSTGAMAWAKRMASAELPADRKAGVAAVRAAGYDIDAEAARLAEFFASGGARFEPSAVLSRREG